MSNGQTAESAFIFRSANKEEDFQDIIKTFPDELLPFANDDEKKKIIEERFRKKTFGFVLRSRATGALSAAVWMLPKPDKSSDVYTVTNLYVNQECRGRGLSNILLSASVCWLFKNTSCKSIVSDVLDTREASLKSHLRAGFVIVGKLYAKYIVNRWRYYSVRA